MFWKMSLEYIILKIVLSDSLSKSFYRSKTNDYAHFNMPIWIGKNKVKKKRNSLPTWLQMTMHIGICPFEYEKRKVQKTKQSPNLVTNDYAHLNMKIWIWKNKVKKNATVFNRTFFFKTMKHWTSNVERWTSLYSSFLSTFDESWHSRLRNLNLVIQH